MLFRDVEDSAKQTPLEQAKLMARAGVEKKLIEEFIKRTQGRIFHNRSGLVDRPAVTKITKALNSGFGRIAGLALERKLGNRSEKVFRQIRPYVEENSKVLDLGCGDGKIGYMLHLDKGCEVQLMDVKNYNKTPLPSEVYNGDSVPRKDNSFEHVLLLTVLHHAENPVYLAKEALRLATKSVIVIESVYFNEMHKNANKVMDWFYNRVLNNHEIPVPFNFLTPTAWVAIFETKMNGNVTVMEHLGIDQPLVPEYHTLYVVEKKSPSPNR